MRRLVIPLAAVALIGVVVLGLTQAGGNSKAPARLTLAQMRKALEGAPPELAAVYRQENTVLGGSTKAFQKQVAALRGHPIVVNKWAAWCGPCRAEFPVFQRVSAARGRAVAFVGIDGHDNRDDATRFLREFPVPYPSYADPDEKISGAVGAPANYPITVMIDERGRTVFVHQGQYAEDAELTADIKRYLGA
jgi:thiol-disulfide isomerase/thioredoxin